MLVSVNKENLRLLRMRKGVSMYHLSVKAGLGKNAIAIMENKGQKSSLLRIEAIAKVLGVNPSELVMEEETKC